MDRISQDKKSVLFLCNGHGEDLIALKILQSIHEKQPDLALEVFPLVGLGKTFDSAVSEKWLHRIGPLHSLPSGGFSNQSLRGFFADIFSGLISLLWQQIQYIRWSESNQRLIVAVGDFLPLFFAWFSGANYVFIGTPKSDYTWTSKPGLSFSDYYHRMKGSEWDPWEKLLMAATRCKFVAVRDQLTVRGLRNNRVPIFFLGNPMMDGFFREPCPFELEKFRRLILLCGSRMPEAKDNFNRLLNASENVKSSSPKAILVALGSVPVLEEVESWLISFGYHKCSYLLNDVKADSCWEKNSEFVFLGIGKFHNWAFWAELGLANAGTATEQMVGMGIPCISLPGKGPQFKYSFARRQSRLLGGSVIPCRNQERFVRQVESLLADEKLRNYLGSIGQKRMGKAGASDALANMILKHLIGNH